ncbi:hypothetical protein [Paenibacillus sp. 32O-W]|uniref:hypothetical protein n=1 Tax=Paenibacillus sp. 32O-W TaxID=1695218 RepID=UPI0011AE4DBA|nr:hypothetical protein [Paenibacillus sp. 32O-W]
MAKSLRKCRNFARKANYGIKFLQKYSNFWRFSLTWLERIKKTALSQEFSRFGSFTPEKIAFLQLFSFIRVLSYGCQPPRSRSKASNFGTGGSSQRDWRERKKPRSGALTPAKTGAACAALRRHEGHKKSCRELFPAVFSCIVRTGIFFNPNIERLRSR